MAMTTARSSSRSPRQNEGYPGLPATVICIKRLRRLSFSRSPYETLPPYLGDRFCVDACRLSLRSDQPNWRWSESYDVHQRRHGQRRFDDDNPTRHPARNVEKVTE